MLAHSPNACNVQSRAGSRLGARNTRQVHVPVPALDSFFPVLTLGGRGVESVSMIPEVGDLN